MNRTMHLVVTGTGMVAAAILIAGPVQATTGSGTPVTPVPASTAKAPADGGAGQAPASPEPSASPTSSPAVSPAAVAEPAPSESEEIVTGIQVGPWWPGPVD